jgi:type III pantothenate kinase
MMAGAPFLLIDAGNSRVKWALADAPGVFQRSGVFSHYARAREADTRNGQEGDAGEPTAPNLADGEPGEVGKDAAAQWAALARPGGAWISNVAGEAAGAWLAALIEARWPGLPVTFVRARAAQCGVANGYGAPDRLGSDRWAGLIGAHAAYPGEALLIATLGTATTLEALTADGRFVGGMIAPGWSLMMRSLGEHTAQLPTLEDDSVRTLVGDAFAQRWFATDTRRAITAGSLLAQAGLIERAWRELEQAWAEPVRLVLTGGAANEVGAALSVAHTRHDSLVLSGLALIAAADEPAARC